MSIAAHETKFQFPSQRAFGRDSRDQKLVIALTAELVAARTREAELLREKRDLSQRQCMLAQEFEHRLLNGLQSVVSMLSLQRRAATTPEAADQLKIAAHRVTALGRVHQQLHVLDFQDHVEFKQYLQHLCADLSDLLLQKKIERAIVVESEEAKIPTTFAIPLGFIVNELTTNSAKYAKGNITVRFESTSLATYSLSVLDAGPGLPPGFDPANGKGLGMKIVRSLVNQIGGELHVLAGNAGRGTCFTVTFTSETSKRRPPPGTNLGT